MALTSKQQAYLNQANHRWNFKTGATRSGKTFLDYTAVIPLRLQRCTGDGLAVMLGNTQGTVDRNVLEPMRRIWGPKLVGNIKQGTNTVQLFGRKVYIFGADKVTRVSKIQGQGIEYCYGDEVTTWNQGVFDMLKSRLDKQNSRFDGTCNPEGPNHWLKKFLDRTDFDLYHQHYTIDDNPTLPAEFVKNLKAEYACTIYYDRFILGRWVPAEGMIYPMFSTGEGGHVVDASQYTYTKYYISVDYGTMNPFSAGLWGKATEGAWVRIREYYHDGRNQKRQLTDEEYHDALVALAGNLSITSVIVDPSAASFIACLNKHRIFRTRPAENGVLDGIRNTASALQRRKILIDRSCEATANEFHSYVWDEKADQDRPLKQNDHAMDDIRYFVNTIIAAPKLFDFT